MWEKYGELSADEKPSMTGLPASISAVIESQSKAFFDAQQLVACNV